MNHVEADALKRILYLLFHVDPRRDRKLFSGDGCCATFSVVTWKIFQRKIVDSDFIYSRQIIGIRDILNDVNAGYETLNFTFAEKSADKFLRVEILSSSFRSVFRCDMPPTKIFEISVKQIQEDSSL